MPRRRPPCSHEDNPQDSAKDAAGEGPPCPPDMTPAEWVAFVRGKQCTVRLPIQGYDAFICTYAVHTYLNAGLPPAGDQGHLLVSPSTLLRRLRNQMVRFPR